MIFRSKAWPWIMAASLWCGGAALGCVLATSTRASARPGTSLLARTLSSSAHGLAQYSVLRADAAYHRGRARYTEEAFTGDVFHAMRRAVAPVGHVHLSGGEVREMLPWLRFATWLEPHDVETHLVAAYWLMGEAGRPGQAMALLNEAQRNNPRSYLVYLGKGRIFAKADNKTMARRCYDRALDLWPSGRDPGDEEVRLDRRELLARRAVLSELDGRIDLAIRDMREIIRLFPERPLSLFRQRLAALERGERPADSAEQKWNALRNEQYHHFCEGVSGHDHDSGKGEKRPGG